MTDAPSNTKQRKMSVYDFMFFMCITILICITMLVLIIAVIIIPKMPSESARQGLFISLSVIGALIFLFVMIDFSNFIYDPRTKTNAEIIFSTVMYGFICLPWILFYVFFALHNTIVDHEREESHDSGWLARQRKNLERVRIACLVASIIILALVLIINKENFAQFPITDRKPSSNEWRMIDACDSVLINPNE